MEMVKYYRSIIVLVFSFGFFCLQGGFVDLDSNNVELISTHEMRFCYISFVKVDGKIFLVKQKKIFNKLLGCVRDAITSHIARHLINAHEVDIIPADKDFPGKVLKNWPATIHTVAPGKMIKELKNVFKAFNIKQGEEGFRHNMIKWMIEYPELVKIIAVDTFLCNHDRHRGNIFYDPRTGLFCAIDMDSSFKYNLCALACKNLTEMFKESCYSLKSKEIRALIAYKKAIHFLIKTCNPDRTIKVFDEFIRRAGFVKGSDLYIERFERELAANKEIIRQSYKDAQRLVKLLSRVIKQSAKHTRGFERVER